MPGSHEPTLVGMPSRIITTQPPKGAVRVVLRGEIDIDSAGELRHILRELARSHRSVVIDASAATLIDSTILLVVVAASKRLPGGVWVKGATGGVRRLFVIGGLQHLLID